MKDSWEGRLVGTVDEAAAICGCTVKTYRSYQSRIGAPKPVGYDPDTGLQRFDLAAVQAWHKARPGKPVRTDLHRSTDTKET